MAKRRDIYIYVIHWISFLGFSISCLSAYKYFLRALERWKLLSCLYSRFYPLCKIQSAAMWYVFHGLLLYPWYIPLQISCHDLENKSFWRLAFLCSNGKTVQWGIPSPGICVFNNWTLSNVLLGSKALHWMSVTHFFQHISSLYKINLSLQT
jgi:hypothetical protein